MKLFSYKNRPVHLGLYPQETLKRIDSFTDFNSVPAMKKFRDDHSELSLSHSINRHLALMDIVRDGDDVHGPAQIPSGSIERTEHLKSAAYYFDASMIGVCKLEQAHHLDEPLNNPNIHKVREELENQDKDYAQIIEDLYKDVIASTKSTLEPIKHHQYAMVFLTEYVRDPRDDEPGTDWIQDIQPERAALLNANTAVLIANYIRLLGFEARAHTVTCSDVDLNRLGVSSGLCAVDPASNDLINPFVGKRFGLVAITTTMELITDKPLDPASAQTGTFKHGMKWAFGVDGVKTAGNHDPYKSREFRMGAYPFEKIKRVDTPTTFIDEDRVPRMPKRADFFDRALHGDLGKKAQKAAIHEMFVVKSPMGGCSWRALGSLVLFQTGEARGPISETLTDPSKNADNVKAASYFLSADATGISRAPDWAYYSHGSHGETITPYHDNAISLLLDQGHETMEGASGDDWIAVGQSMRAYLRFSLLGNVIAEHIRRLGYSAQVHSVIDQDVIQPPLLLLAGLGEVSRIGDVILNPFLGPRLKSGVITTSMPMAHDKPIDFGLQTFCENCNKCARECPSGAITAGPKSMFNGYEIWKSDSEKCTRYRITNEAGAMCGRCMKTCPWNLEGLFSDSAFRWLAINAPASAKTLAKLDDTLNRGSINPVKKWWWDIQMSEDHSCFVQAPASNARELQKEIQLNYEDQSLAAYPADTAAAPYPVMQPVDRDAGIERYRSLLSPQEHKRRLASNDTDDLVPTRDYTNEEPPVFPLVISKRIDLTSDIFSLELSHPDGKDLPKVEAGAHIDVCVAPEFIRQYSLAGNPADSSKYELGILREEQGRGGSELMHEVFTEGRTVYVSPPRNHFPLDENSPFSILMAGGIGVTPMIAMAHRLHALEKPFIFHFSGKSTEQSGYASVLKSMPWADNVFFHFSQEGSRADLDELIPNHQQGYKLYTCGSDRYMDAIFEAGMKKGWDENSLSREYFSVPEQPDYENHEFILKLMASGKSIEVSAEMSAAEALLENGIHIDVKCSDGLCGVCVEGFQNGDIDHRDFVLSGAEREDRFATCCSRAKNKGDVIEINL